MGGTDPPQYLAVAEKFIPVLKPDFVILNFNLSNDLQFFNRPVIPFKPVMWITNAGYLLSCPDGIYFKDYNEVYSLSLENCYIPQTSSFNKFCSNTIISTLLWSALAKHYNWDTESPKMKRYKQQVQSVQRPTPYSNDQIDSIQKIAIKAGSKFVLMVIPEVYTENGNLQLRYPNQFSNLFPGIKYYVPHYQIKCYTEDGHFNEEGHVMYANLLGEIIDSCRMSSTGRK